MARWVMDWRLIPCTWLGTTSELFWEDWFTHAVYQPINMYVWISSQSPTSGTQRYWNRDSDSVDDNCCHQFNSFPRLLLSLSCFSAIWIQLHNTLPSLAKLKIYKGLLDSFWYSKVAHVVDSCLVSSTQSLVFGTKGSTNCATFPLISMGHNSPRKISCGRFTERCARDFSILKSVGTRKWAQPSGLVDCIFPSPTLLTSRITKIFCSPWIIVEMPFLPIHSQYGASSASTVHVSLLGLATATVLDGLYLAVFLGSARYAAQCSCCLLLLPVSYMSPSQDWRRDGGRLPWEKPISPTQQKLSNECRFYIRICASQIPLIQSVSVSSSILHSEITLYFHPMLLALRSVLQLSLLIA